MANPSLDLGFLTMQDLEDGYNSPNREAWLRTDLNLWTAAAGSWLPHGCFEEPTGSPPRELGCFMPAADLGHARNAPPRPSPQRMARLMHLHAHARAELVGAMQRERQARIVWTAVRAWCDAEQVTQPTSAVVADTAYDANVQAAAHTLVTMGVPLRHLALAERISLQAPQHALIDTFY